MKKIIMALLFALTAGVCFGEMTVAVFPIEQIAYMPKISHIEPEVLTRLLKTSIAKCGYTVVDGSGDRALTYYNYFHGSKKEVSNIGKELNVNFVIYGLVYKSYLFIDIFDVKNNDWIYWSPIDFKIYLFGNSKQIIITKNKEASGKKIDNFVLANLGNASIQQEFQQEIVKREASPETEAWRNKNVYMSIGAGGGFSGGSVFISRDEQYSGSGVALAGSLQFDFGESTRKMSKKGEYLVGYQAIGTGMSLSGADGNVAFWIPLEWRGATRFERTEVAGGIGTGIGFGGGAFMWGFNARGSLGWKAGNGIIFLELVGQFGSSVSTETVVDGNAYAFSGLLLLGYKFGF
jgi:hypothetical protein